MQNNQPDQWQINLKFGSESFRNGMDPASFIGYLAKLGEINVQTFDDAIPLWKNFDPESCYLRFSIQLTGEAITLQKIEEVFEFVEDDCEIDIQQMTGDDSAEASLGDQCLWTADGSLTIYNVLDVKSQLDELLVQDFSDYVFDLSQVEEVDTAGIQLLLCFKKLLLSQNKSFKVESVSTDVAALFSRYHLSEGLA
jgi:anti-anti-sigma regulatory factor